MPRRLPFVSMCDLSLQRPRHGSRRTSKGITIRRGFSATVPFATSRPSAPSHAMARREKTTLDRYSPRKSSGTSTSSSLSTTSNARTRATGQRNARPRRPCARHSAPRACRTSYRPPASPRQRRTPCPQRRPETSGPAPRLSGNFHNVVPLARRLSLRPQLQWLSCRPAS